MAGTTDAATYLLGGLGDVAVALETSVPNLDLPEM